VVARHLATVHVPRRFYVSMLPGIPTIRVFEALACGIPLVSAPWNDAEGLFSPGFDYLVARDESQMEHHLRALSSDPDLRRALVENGLSAIRRRHSCAHRVDQLLAILSTLGAAAPMEMSA
jgi:spore maturation protein CgeB